MDLEPLKPGSSEPNPPAEPAYSAPKQEDIVLPEENDEPDVFDEEAGVGDDLDGDFDAEEQNAKESEQ
jgi:hypothetical protein